jgi:RHS repeat-associated protein
VLDELQSNAVTRTYAYGLELVSETQLSANLTPPASPWITSYYGYDGHGSVRYLTDSTGAVTDTYDYDGFGNLIHSTGTTPNLYLFAGEQFDPDLGLYYNRARYLDVKAGRFWGMDAYEGKADSPSSLHKYLYVDGDPVQLWDRSGNDPDLASLMIASAITIGLMTLTSCRTQRAVIISVAVAVNNDWSFGNEPGDTLNNYEQGTVKDAAFQEMRAAYTGYAVFFSEGPSGPREIRVDNGGGQPGETMLTSVVSEVHLEALALTMERLLNCRSLTDCETAGYDRMYLLTSLGKGLGATCAHELGHQAGLHYTEDIVCPDCYDSDTAATSAHFFGTLHWSDAAAARMKNVLPGGGPSQ